MGVTASLAATIERYNAAWAAHDVEAIMALHAPDMVFENHTAGERAEGEAVRAHVTAIFEAWPDIAFTTRRLYVRDDLVVQVGAPKGASRMVQRIGGRCSIKKNRDGVGWRQLFERVCVQGARHFRCRADNDSDRSPDMSEKARLQGGFHIRR